MTSSQSQTGSGSALRKGEKIGLGIRAKDDVLRKELLELLNADDGAEQVADDVEDLRTVLEGSSAEALAATDDTTV